MADKILASYDFPTIVNNSRAIQLLCTVLQLIFIYTESGSLPFLTFLFYSILVGMHVLHLARRWHYSIDGRYDVRQIIRDTEMTLRIQYIVAIFSPVVLGLITYSFVELKNGLVHSLFHCSSFIQILCASIQLGCEFFEVAVSTFKNGTSTAPTASKMAPPSTVAVAKTQSVSNKKQQ